MFSNKDNDIMRFSAAIISKKFKLSIKYEYMR